MGFHVINRCTYLIFNTDLILQSYSHGSYTWMSGGIHHISVWSTACFQVLIKYLHTNKCYCKVKKIKISIFLLMRPHFSINILISASHKFFQRHWQLKILVSVCDHKLVHVDSEKFWSLMDGLSKHRRKLLAFPVISNLWCTICIWNVAGKSLQSACLFTRVHSTWIFTNESQRQLPYQFHWSPWLKQKKSINTEVV